MVMSYKAGPELGIIEVHTKNEGGHPVEKTGARLQRQYRKTY